MTSVQRELPVRIAEPVPTVLDHTHVTVPEPDMEGQTVAPVIFPIQ